MKKYRELEASELAAFAQRYYRELQPATRHPHLVGTHILRPENGATTVRSAFEHEDHELASLFVGELFKIVRGSKTEEGSGLAGHYEATILRRVRNHKQVSLADISPEKPIVWLLSQFAESFPEYAAALFSFLRRNGLEGLRVAFSYNSDLFNQVLSGGREKAQNTAQIISDRMNNFKNNAFSYTIDDGDVGKYEAHCAGPGLARAIMRVGSATGIQLAEIFSSSLVDFTPLRISNEPTAISLDNIASRILLKKLP